MNNLKPAVARPMIDHIKHFSVGKYKREMFLVFVEEDIKTINVLDVKLKDLRSLLEKPSFVGVVSNNQNKWGGQMYISYQDNGLNYCQGLFVSDHPSKIEAAVALKMKVFNHIDQVNMVKPPEKELEERLKSHDWYYYQSDDQRIFLSGEKSFNRINELVFQLGDLGKDLYNKFCPKEFVK